MYSLLSSIIRKSIIQKMNNPLTANQLEFLSVLYVERHLSKTCNKLGITQPTGSRFLSSLREIFKDDLFIKSGSGMVPTEKCVRLMPEIENNLSNLNFLVRDEVFNPKTLRKTFRLGLVDNAFFSILMPLLGRIKEQAPHVNFCIPEIRFTDLFQSLVDDEVDLRFIPTRAVSYRSIFTIWTYLKSILSMSPEKDIRLKVWLRMTSTTTSIFILKSGLVRRKNLSLMTRATVNPLSAQTATI